MDTTKPPTAILATEVPPRAKASNYPASLAVRVAGRQKRALGNVFGLANFGVNLTRLVPGSASALRHYHSKQDEFIYILSGFPTLVTDEGDTPLAPGMCAGFKAGVPNGHMLVNRSEEDVVYLEVGDRTPGDEGAYPDDDIKAVMTEGGWRFTHKDGTAYQD